MYLSETHSDLQELMSSLKESQPMKTEKIKQTNGHNLVQIQSYMSEKQL